MLWFILALAGAIFTAGVYAVQKKLLRNASEYAVPFLTYFISSIVLLAIAFSAGIPEIKSGFIYSLAVSLVLNCVGVFLYLKAFKITDISLAVPILSFTPLLSILTSYIMLGERTNLLGILGILLVVLGVYLLNFKKSRDIFQPFKEFFRNKGLRYMFIVAFIFAVCVNVDKMILLKSDVFFGWGISQFLMSMVFLLIVLSRKENLGRIVKNNLPLILLGGIFATLDTLFFGIAFKMQIVPYVIAIKRTSILFTVIYGGMFLREKDILKRLLAAAIMVMGLLTIIFSSA